MVVMWNGSIVKAEVVDPTPGKFTKRFEARSETRGGHYIAHNLRYADEGTEWCRGHEGEDVDALMATASMADKTQPLRPAATSVAGRGRTRRS